MYLKWRALVVAALALGGCATAAQQHLGQIRSLTGSVAAEGTACIASVNNRPEYAPLLVHTVDSSGQPTMRMLTDETIPSTEESRLLAQRHDDRVPCRKRIMERVTTTLPAVADLMLREWAASDGVTALLVQRKITWAEGARRTQKIVADARSDLLSIDQQTMAELRAEHQDELMRRQAAANALMRWSLDQQMINAINRPTVTTCSALGTFTNCISH